MLIALNFSKQIIRKSSHGGNEDFQTNLHICTAGRFLVHIWMTDENLCSECLENFVSEQYRIILIYFSFVFQIYSLKDLPGFLACFSSKITKPMIDSTSHLVGHILLPAKMVSEYVLSSKMIECLIPNVVVIEQISKIEIEVDELADDSDDNFDEINDDILRRICDP